MNQYNPEILWKKKTPPPRKEVEEFGAGKPEFVICSVCKAVYYKKSWHHEFPQNLGREDKLIRFLECPACLMARNKMFEGQVILDKVPRDRLKEVLARIEHVGRLAYAKDVLARIIKVKRIGGRIEILTSENQLALLLGKQVQEILRGKLDIRFSEDESVVRVYWRPR